MIDSALDTVEKKKKTPLDNIAMGDILVDVYLDKAEKGKMGLTERLKENVATGKGLLGKIPFLGSGIGLAQMVEVRDAMHRLESDFDYSRKVVIGASGFRQGSYSKEADVALIEDYLTDYLSKSVRGVSTAGMATDIVSNLPTLILEMAATGGLAKIGSEPIKRGTAKLLKSHAEKAAGKALINIAGAMAGTATRSAGFAGRVAEDYQERQVQGQLGLRAPESELTSAVKAYGDTYIELLSEASGEGIGTVAKGGGKMIEKLVRKSKFGDRLMDGLFDVWRKTHPQNSFTEFMEMMFEKGQWNGYLEEIGEERLGTLLRAMTGVEDFGAGRDASMAERIKAGMKNDLNNLPAELIAFAVPGVAKSGVGYVGNRIERDDTRALREQILTPGGAEMVLQDNPTWANRIASTEQPSRKDFAEVGLTGWSADERKQMSGLLKQAITQHETDLKEKFAPQAAQDSLDERIAQMRQPQEMSVPSSSAEPVGADTTVPPAPEEAAPQAVQPEPAKQEDASENKPKFKITKARLHITRNGVIPEVISETTYADESQSPHRKLADRTRDILRDEPDTAFDNPAVERLSQEIFGKAAGHGRDAYDAMEAGMNMHIAENVDVPFDRPEEAIDTLQKLSERMPRQTRRDETQVEFQQFSTPPAEGFLAVYAAGIEKGMTALEPSAGTGNLAVLMKKAGANVTVNEIDPRRTDLLQHQGYETTSIDAENLDNLMDGNAMFDVVVMNPPFSATGGRVSGHNTMFGAKHLEQALFRVKKGGRLVAIVGRGMAMDRPAFRDWWQKMMGKYNVRANLGMDGKIYGKFGTTFGNQIVIIDNTGPTVNEDAVVTGENLSPQDALALLKEIAKENVNERIRDIQKPGTKSTGPVSRPGSQEPGHRFAGPDRTKRGPDTPVPESGQQQQPERVEPTGSKTEVVPDAESRSEGRTETADTEQKRDDQTDRVADRGEPGRSESADRTVTETRQAKEEEGTVYSEYVVRKAKPEGSKPHPANIVESTVMASVESPDVSYKHSIPKEVITEGRLSDLQMEAVIYAGQAHSQLLPDGSRKGYWIGDGTGLGKGREIYGIIYDNFMKGRKKAVHISIGHQLWADAKRDAEGVGVPLSVISQKEDMKTHEAISAEEGVFFSTYGMLAQDWKKGAPRFQQLVDWLGEDFDGVIAFDESHAMKNAAASGFGEKVSTDQGTDRGNMGIELQRRFPKARIIYVSATGATESRHITPYERLGLWGKGAPFGTFIDFVNAIKRGGVAAMEMLSRDLKAVGSLIARTISYKGVEYDNLEYKLTELDASQYDRFADLWKELLEAFDAATENANQKKGGSQFSQFYSTQQRFFLNVMMAYEMPSVIKSIESDLNSGKSIVISLYNTGESQAKDLVNKARSEGLDLDELEFTPREAIINLIKRQFPLEQYEDYTDKKSGMTRKRPVTDSAGNPVINRENLRKQQELIDKVSEMDFPENPLDTLMNHFGPEKIAEISGRSHRMEHGQYVSRKIKGVKQSRLNEFETKAFQGGKKRIAVISGAGSTGISLHADVNSKNKQRRVFYALQLSWSADQQMQSFGRVHRSFQDSAPIIRMVTLNLAGQKRLINAVARRLAALGAVTKGERKSLSGDMFSIEDLTDSYGKAALTKTYDELMSGKYRTDGLSNTTAAVMGILDKNGNVKKASVDDVDTFLNRIMALPVEKQNVLFERFYVNYLTAVEKAKEGGAFDYGVEEIKASGLKVAGEPQVLHTDTGSGAKTELYELEGEVETSKLPFNVAKLNYAKVGFYRNKASGHIYAVREHTSPQKSRTHYLLHGVRDHVVTIEKEEIKKYEKVSESEAQSWWKKTFDEIKPTEKKTFHLMTGAIFPIYDKIMGEGERGISNTKVARAVLENGKALVGLRLSKKDIPRVKQRLGIGSSLKGLTGEDAAEMLDGGAVIELDNGWRIQGVSLLGDRVVEVVGGGGQSDELTGYGFKNETIHYKKRWFVHADNAPDVLDKLFASHKPIRDVTSRDAYGPVPMTIETTQKDERKKSAKPTEAMDIVKTAEFLFNIVVRSGKVLRNKAGVYRWKPEVIRTQSRYYGDLAVLSHELAHHIDKQSTVLDGLKKPLREELQALDYEPGKKRTGEGWAEFFRAYLTTDSAARIAPRFSAYFEEWLSNNSDYAKKIKTVRDMITDWRTQGAVNRVKSQIKKDGKPSIPAGVSKWEHLKQQFSDFAVRFNAAWKDEGAFIQRFVEYARQRGMKLGDGQSPYDLFLAMTQSGPTHAMEAIESGVFAMTGGMERLGPSLKEALTGITKENYDDFIAYAYARHALEAIEKGHNPGIDKVSAEATLRELENDTFLKAAAALTDFNNGLIRMLSDAGVITEDAAEKIMDAWDTYLPLERVVDKRFWSAGLGGKKVVNVPEPLKRRSKDGSSLPIKDPVQATIERAIRFYTRATQQTVINAMVKIATETEGMGFQMELIRPANKTTSFKLEEIQPQLEKLGVDIKSLVESGEVDVEEWLHIYRPSYEVKGAKPIARVIVDGKPKLFEFDPDLFRAVNGMDYFELPYLLELTFGRVTRGIKLGATGINIAFAQRNIYKDFATYMVQSRYGVEAAASALPVPIPGGPGSMLMAYIGSEVAHLMGTQENVFVELWKQMGGPLSQRLGLDNKRIRKTIDDVIADGTKRRLYNVVRNPVEMLRDIIGVSEVGPRLAEFQASLKAQGYDKEALEELRRQGKRPTRDVLVKAINDASDVTTNFKRMGYYGKYFNRMIAYWNAPIEGTSKFVRTWKENPKRAFVFAASSVAVSTAYWLINKDEDWYKEQPAWLKYGFYTIAIDGKPMFRIPRVHLWGMIGAGAESMLETMHRDNPKEVAAWLDKAFDETGIPGLSSDGLMKMTPDTFRIGAETYRGWDSFRDKPIVNESLSRLEPKDQFTPKTLEFSKWLGRLMVSDDPNTKYKGISPARLEHLIESLSGGLYGNIVGLAEKTVKGEPVGNPLTVGVNIRGDYSESVSEFYEKLKLTEQAYNSAKKNDKLSDDLDAQNALLQGHSELMNKIRKTVDGVSDRDGRFAVEKYIIGLARHALDKEALDRYPNPLQQDDLPETIKPLVDRYLGQKLFAMTSPQPVRKKGEPLDDYRQRRAEWEKTVNRGLSLIKSIEMDEKRALTLLRQEAKRRGMRIEPDSVYADRLRQMKRKL
jgi:predicted RNA methylase